MNFVYLKDFFANYSLPTCVIAIIVSVITFLYDKFLSEKLPITIRTYAPFALCVIFYFCYDMIFLTKTFTFRETAFYAGILAGSLSAVILSSINRISRGKPLSLSATALIIESIISGHVAEDKLMNTVLEIEKIVKKDDCTHEQIVTVLKGQSVDGNDERFVNLSKLIISAVKTTAND